MFVLSQLCRSELKLILEAKIGILMFVISTLGALASFPGGLKFNIFDICILLVSNSVEAANTMAVDAYISCE